MYVYVYVYVYLVVNVVAVVVVFADVNERDYDYVDDQVHEGGFGFFPPTAVASVGDLVLFRSDGVQS